MASGSKDLAAPSIGFSYDKLTHLLVFGLLATAALRIPRISNLGWRGVFITILLISTSVHLMNTGNPLPPIAPSS